MLLAVLGHNYGVLELSPRPYIDVRNFICGVVYLLVSVENRDHCDFKLLRQSVICANLDDLCVTTNEVHYEAFRKRKLPKMGYVSSTDSNLSFTETLERERARVTAELQRREDEMRATFIRRVKDKESELQVAEQALNNKYNKLKVSCSYGCTI